MTKDPQVLAYAKQVVEEWGPYSADEIELLSRILAPRLRAVRERSKNVRPDQRAA